MRLLLALGLSLVVSATSQAINIVAENGGQSTCQIIDARRELRVFKDPTLFLGNLGLFMADPKVGWYRLMQETPLLRPLKGRISLMRLGAPREFKNFGVIARLYESVEPRLRLTDGRRAQVGESVKIVPVQICGDGALGFVLEEDLKQAVLEERERFGHSMPSSVNEIPEYREPSKSGAESKEPASAVY